MTSEEQGRAALTWMQKQAKALDPGSDGSSVLDCARIISGRLAHPKEPAQAYLSVESIMDLLERFAVLVEKRGWGEDMQIAKETIKAGLMQMVSPHPTPSVLSKEVKLTAQDMERIADEHGYTRGEEDDTNEVKGQLLASRADFINGLRTAQERLFSSPAPTQHFSEHDGMIQVFPKGQQCPVCFPPSSPTHPTER